MRKAGRCCDSWTRPAPWPSRSRCRRAWTRAALLATYRDQTFLEEARAMKLEFQPKDAIV
jgi:hypothetical protein